METDTSMVGPDVARTEPQLAPLVLARIASQGLLVALSPKIVAAARSRGASVAVFLSANVLVGLAFSCLLSAGFAGVAAFPQERRPRTIRLLAGANALAWILVNPIVGVVTGWLSCVQQRWSLLQSR